MSQEIAAAEIAEDLLYRTGKALMEGDADLFLFCFSPPIIVETADVERLMRTEDDVRAGFERVRAHLRSEGVTSLVRTVVCAEFIEADTIGSTHVTSLMNDEGETVRKPFPTYSVIKRRGDFWKIVSMVYVILDSEEHNRAITGEIPNDAKVER